jgi:uncharacterized membrane protein YgcG
MDDAMLDLMAGDARLRGRMDAYAEARLSPDLTATSRMRARVLAGAHRQAALARADASLIVVSPTVGDDDAPAARSQTRPAVGRRTTWRRATAILLAAGLAMSLFAGSTLAAVPGGPLYATRLWVETLTLPTEPSARAVAELDRLRHRIEEAQAASRAGDASAAAAALSAYAAILDDASTRVMLDGDPVAAAAFEAGVGRNVDVLRALAARLPEGGAAAVTTALERAIARSDEAVDAIHEQGNGGNGSGGSSSGGSGNGGQPTPGQPGATPSPAPASTSTATPKPTKAPETKTSKPTKAPTPEPAAEPTPTPRPGRTPPAGARPSPPSGGAHPTPADTGG